MFIVVCEDWEMENVRGRATTAGIKKNPACGKRDLIVGQGLYSFVTLTHDFPLYPVGKVKEVAIKVALRCHFVNYLWFDEGKSKENLTTEQ